MTRADEFTPGAGPYRSIIVDVEGMNAVLAGNWWAIALRGIAAILLGLVALFFTGAALFTLVIVFGAYMLADAVFAAIAAVRAARRHERWLLLVLEAVVNLAAGAITFFRPGLTVFAFVIVVAAWSLMTGGLAVAAAFRLKRALGRWWMVAGGVASLALGVLLVIFPLVGAVVLTWWIGAYAIIFGISCLALAYQLRIHKDDTLEALAAAT